MTGRPGVNSPLRDAVPDGIVTVNAEGSVHPWVEDLRGVAPAKRIQIMGLVNSLGVTMPTGQRAWDDWPTRCWPNRSSSFVCARRFRC
ncbi:hypothetical protein ACRAWD_05495 [Caulobacter segnis]